MDLVRSYMLGFYICRPFKWCLAGPVVLQTESGPVGFEL